MQYKDNTLLNAVETFILAVKKSHHDFVKDMAASIAFFTFFSLFPLLLGLVALSGYFLDFENMTQYLDQILYDALPGSGPFVRENIETIIRLRGAAGLVSIIGLLWSAQKMSGAVSRGINRTLGLRRTHPAILSRVRYFLITLSIPVLLLLMIGVLTFIELLMTMDFTSYFKFTHEYNRLGPILRKGITFLLVMGVFLLIYKYVPYDKMAWESVFPGALIAALFYELGKWAFLLYLENVAKFEAVYGSLSSIIVLLIWLYYSARVLLFGSEIIAVNNSKQMDHQRSSIDPSNETIY